MNVLTKKKNTNGRQVILDAAVDAFYELGYQAASVREIGRRSGVTQAALYHHFNSKDAILLTIIDEFSELLFMAVVASMSSDENSVKRLKRALRRHFDFMKTHRKQLKILFEDKSHLKGHAKKIIEDREKSIFNLYRANLEELTHWSHFRHRPNGCDVQYLWRAQLVLPLVPTRWSAIARVSSRSSNEFYF